MANLAQSRIARFSTSTAVMKGLVLISAPAQGQSVPDDASQEAENTQIIVTGSALPTTPDAVTVPVNVVSAADIAKAGVSTNVLEILRKQIPAFAGRSNTGNSNAANTNQNTAGGSSIQLRNLDTLILVNGRRVAPSAIATVNGKIFVNVAEIAPSAIQRIEVLTDGASAIYGSDAIGGVVNIILKSDFVGIAANARAAISSDGAYNERSVDATYGVDLMRGVNLTVSGSYSHSSPLFQNRRGFASPFYSTSTAVPGAIGSYYLSPALLTPTLTATSPATDPQYINAGPTTATAPGTGIGGTYDLSRFNTILLEQEQKSAVASFNADLTGTGSIAMFADFEYAKNDNFTRFGPVTSNVQPPVGAPFNPFATQQTVVFGSTNDPKTYTTSEESLRGTAGFKGNLSSIGPGWHWEVGYTHSENSIDQVIDNVIYAGNGNTTNNLNLATAGGYNSAGVATPGGAFSRVFSLSGGGYVIQPALNAFGYGGAIDPASLANVLTAETIHGKSTLDSADAQLVGTVPALPAGRLSFAVGGQWRRESLAGAPDQGAWVHVDGTLATPAQSNYRGGLSADPFSASRTITAQFAEVRLPITSGDWNIPGFYALDLVGAVRHEHYSDAGDSTVPKIGFRWQPIPRQITIRGSYARSFTAPSLYALSGPLNIRQGGGAIITNAFPGAIQGTTQVEDGNNPNLQPAKSTSYSLGVVLLPDFVPHLRIEADFSSVKETGQPAGIGFNNILLDVNAKGSASIFYGNIAKNAFPGEPGAVGFNNPGEVLAYVTDPANSPGGNYANLYMIDRFTNLGSTAIRSINVNAQYDVPSDEWGTFSFATQAAILLSYRYQALPGQPTFDFVGTTTQGGGAQGTLPRLRAYTTLDWTKGPIEVGIANNFVGAVRDIGPGGLSYALNSVSNPSSFFPGHVASYSAWDGHVTWRIDDDDRSRSMSLTFGVNNIFDRQPPVSTNINPAAGAATGATAWRTENNTDVSTYGAIGRLFYVSAGVKF